MTKSPTCCSAQDPVSRAAEIMKSEDVGSVPVIESQQDARLIGMITDRDIVLRVIADGKDYNGAKVQEAMSSGPITCRPEDPLQDALDRMSQHQIRRLPIVDNAGHVVGIISQADVATRVNKPKRTAELLEEISEPIG